MIGVWKAHVLLSRPHVQATGVLQYASQFAQIQGDTGRPPLSILICAFSHKAWSQNGFCFEYRTQGHREATEVAQSLKNALMDQGTDSESSKDQSHLPPTYTLHCDFFSAFFLYSGALFQRRFGGEQMGKAGSPSRSTWGWRCQDLSRGHNFLSWTSVSFRLSIRSTYPCSFTHNWSKTPFCPEGIVQHRHLKEDPHNFFSPFLASFFRFYSRRTQFGTEQVLWGFLCSKGN